MRIGILEHGCGCMTRHEKGRGQAAAGLCVLETAAWAPLASLVAAGELHPYARQLCVGA